MIARKQSASQWINGSILTMTTNLCKMLRKNLPKIITAMILAVFQSTITGWLRCFPGETSKSTLYYQVASVGRRVADLEEAVADFIASYGDLLSNAPLL